MLLFESASGVTDILTLVIFVVYELKDRITIDSVSAKKRKSILLGKIKPTEEYCLALVGTHAFSGNDYISFLKRGKWKMLANYWEMSKSFNLLQKVGY